MAKLSFLAEVVSVSLFMSVILWQETSSSSTGPISSTVTEETTIYTTNGKVSNVCDDVTCPPGKQCVLSADNRPDCVCGRRFCYLLYAPVCGSDGNTYSNVCFLRVAACDTNKNIKIEHNGECNDRSTCVGITCPHGKFCQLNSNGQPECLCNTVCTLQYAPVCGSDGKTYGNRCALMVAACQQNKNITVVHDGECDTGSSCNGKSCPPGKSCEVNSRGQPWCVCDTICPALVDPVCGSDGRTYSNGCQLNVESCQANKDITVSHDGACLTEETVTASSTGSVTSEH